MIQEDSALALNWARHFTSCYFTTCKLYCLERLIGDQGVAGGQTSVGELTQKVASPPTAPATQIFQRLEGFAGVSPSNSSAWL